MLSPKGLPDRSLARRTLAYDGNGAPIQLVEPGQGYSKCSASDLRRIGRIVFKTAPYQWVEFRDLPLKPDSGKPR
jgi:hypothetical protein